MGKTAFRNPFAFLVLKRLLKSEAKFVFGHTGENLEDYIALPNRPFKSLSAEQIQEYKPQITDDGTDDAYNLRRKILDEPKRYFKFSDEHLDKLARCISFYGRYTDWASFEKSLESNEDYIDAARFTKSHWIDVDSKDRIPIDMAAEKYVWYQESYLVRSGILEGLPYEVFIKMREGYALRNVREDEIPLISDIQQHGDIGNRSYGFDHEIVLQLISDTQKFRGHFRLYSGTKKQLLSFDKRLQNIKAASHEENVIVVDELNLASLRLENSSILRLPEVVDALKADVDILVIRPNRGDHLLRTLQCNHVSTGRGEDSLYHQHWDLFEAAIEEFKAYEYDFI